MEGKPAGGASEVIRAAKFYMASQVETGHLCPITMTRASVAALAEQPDLLARVMPVLGTRSYDPAFAPWWTKRGMTLGMGMTEKQGGTDVRSNMTRAERDGDAYRITGHKWFMSAPMCDAFLVLAQAERGAELFLHAALCARRLGQRDPVPAAEGQARQPLQRFVRGGVHGAYAERVGAEGKGIRTIIQMVQLTRQDCAIASAGLMRSGLAHALHHARHRSVFQKHLADQPLMQAVLSDMALHVEASVALVMRLCRSFDRAPDDAREAAYMRLLTPAIKYWVCKSAPGFLYEAMECLGGNGYVEEGILARHYRESPVNAIWEGSGNVMCLDVLRALSREAGSGDRGSARTGRARRADCRARAKRSPSSARRSAGRTASAWRGWRSKSWRCWRLLPRSMRCRRGMRNCSPPRALPGITPACTAQSISLTKTQGLCCSVRCREQTGRDNEKAI